MNYRIVIKREVLVVPEECLVTNEFNTIFLQNVRIGESIYPLLEIPPFTLITKEEL